ncbi:phosphotransferase enzyme family protein [Nocardia altamirensis]|uniref:phosphotransferase enzyme family protein n=1 Tax=Nocardia altamirensis TaxID=472158 RepID=UPI00084094C4|nr:aminoglycoside phosphotransferase family protein [Nocardia altamirensis]
MSSARATSSTEQVLAKAAEISGVDLHGAQVIRDGSNAIYRLAHDMVARIGQPGCLEAAERELRISQWLNNSGIPTVEAMSALRQPVVVADRPVTWWRLIPDHRPSTPAEMGAMLSALHALPPPTELQLPAYDPFTGLHERLVTAAMIDEDDRTWLLSHHTELRTQYDALPEAFSLSVIHGDAWQGNLVVPSSGVPTVLDLDKVSIGRREWDLIQLAVDYTDFSRVSGQDYRAFVEAYGGYDVTSWPGFRVLADIQELRWVGFAIARSPDSPRAAAQAKHRIACLRGQVARPWRWDAL